MPGKLPVVFVIGIMIEMSISAANRRLVSVVQSHIVPAALRRIDKDSRMLTRVRIALLALVVGCMAVAFASSAAVAAPEAIPAAVHAAVVAAQAAGEGDAGHEKVGALATPKQGIATTVTTIIVFIIVAVVLLTLVWPKISKGLDDRNNKIKEEIEAAEMARSQAKDALEQYQNSLASARAEAQKMLEQTRTQQAAMAEELKKKSDAELAQMRERAMRDIEMAKKAAVAEIYAEAANLAGTMAGKILRKNITIDDQARLIEETVGSMKASRN